MNKLAIVQTLSLAAFMLPTSLMATPVDVDLHIISGSSWRSTDIFFDGWQDTGFDDSNWEHARGDYPNPTPPQTYIQNTTASYMWHDPEDISTNGMTGPIHAFFRYTTVEIPQNANAWGTMSIDADDDFELFVNGEIACEDHSGGFEHGTAHKVLIKLISGKNTFAIHAVDGGWEHPRERLYEWVLVDVTFRTVPEPSTLTLLSLSMLGLGFNSIKKRNERTTSRPVS